LAQLEQYNWPGNVRELEHLIQRAVLVCRDDRIEVEDLALESVSEAIHSPRQIQQQLMPFTAYQQWLANQEKQYLEQVLEKTNGLVYGEGGAAQLLDVHPEKLRARLRKYGLRRSN